MTAFGFWLACLGGMFAGGYLGQKADEWRDRREAAKRRALQERIEAVLAVACHHCGQTPDEDGDHSCVCFMSDSECLWHTYHPVAPLDLIRAALAEPTKAVAPDA